MTVISQPNVTLSIVSAETDVQNVEQRVLLVGQADGTATAGVLVENISSSGNPENTLFGANSQLAEMVRAFKSVAPIVPVDAIPLTGVGAAREVEITVTGAATAAGSYEVTVGSEIHHTVDVNVASGDAFGVVASAIAAAITADTEAPFTASATLGVVTVTAVDVGLVANGLSVGVSGSVAGIVFTPAITETVAGTGIPVLAGVLDVATRRYQGIVWPWVSDTSEVVTYLGNRFNANNNILDGVAFSGDVSSHAAALTSLLSLNSHDLVVIFDEAITEALYLGPAQNEASYAKSALFAGIRAMRLTQDAQISRFLISSASLDQFGGPASASLPYFNSVMVELPGISSGRGWTDVEIEQLKDAGGSVLGVNRAGTNAVAGEMVTTYLTDGAGNPDPTFTTLNNVDVSSNMREYFWNNLKAIYGQSRLTEGTLTPGRDMANSLSIATTVERLYTDLAGPSFVLVQDGEEALNFFKANLVVTTDLVTGTVQIAAQVPINTQLRNILGTLQIAFSTNG